MTTTDSLHGREQDFHDAWGASIDPSTVLVDESFTVCTAPEGRLIASWLGSVEGKTLLDLGCGAGEAAVFFAKRGAHVTALDISAEMLRVVERVASHHEVSVSTVRSAGESIPLPNDSFDIVYAGNYLHHVSMRTALEEIRRVLKPGGIVVTWDPLAHNPLINVYRLLATKVRTPDEHPLSVNDLELFKSGFKQLRFEMTWLFTQSLFLYFFLIERVNPNKERYWKKILSEHVRLERPYRILEKLDRKVLRIFPWLKRYCWNTVVFAVKE